MPKHESKTCPNCQTSFECKSRDIVNCQCESIELNQQHRDYIYDKYDDCLCAGCMEALRGEFNVFVFEKKIKGLLVKFG